MLVLPVPGVSEHNAHNWPELVDPLVDSIVDDLHASQYCLEWAVLYPAFGNDPASGNVADTAYAFHEIAAPLCSCPLRTRKNCAGCSDLMGKSVHASDLDRFVVIVDVAVSSRP